MEKKKSPLSPVCLEGNKASLELEKVIYAQST